MGNESARQSFSVESTTENKNAKQNLSHGYAFRILSFHSSVKTQLSVFKKNKLKLKKSWDVFNLENGGE